MAEEQNNDNLPELTDKQRLFVDFYFVFGCNATKAAIAAGYSERTARQQGSRLLTNVDISTHVRARMDESAMTAQEVLHHLADIARFDFGELVDDNGNVDMKQAKELGYSRRIRKVKQRTYTTEQADIVETEIETVDPVRALELLGKHHKLFVERHELTGADGGAIEVKAIDYRTSLSALAPESDE